MAAIYGRTTAMVPTPTAHGKYGRRNEPGFITQMVNSSHSPATSDGNNDVYIIPSAGGTPKRLTFHPYEDLVRNWDGNDKIIFASSRSVWHNFMQQLLVNINTGINNNWPCRKNQGSVSPMVKFTAYVRSVDVNEWANFRLYRGGDMLRIWIFNNQTHDVEEIPAARSNSGQPVWTDNNTIFFLSDRDNHYVNVYKYNLSSKAVTQVTALRDIDNKTLSANGNELAYEQAGKIFFTQCLNRPVNTRCCQHTGRYGNQAPILRRCRW